MSMAGVWEISQFFCHLVWCWAINYFQWIDLILHFTSKFHYHTILYQLILVIFCIQLKCIHHCWVWIFKIEFKNNRYNIWKPSEIYPNCRSYFRLKMFQKYKVLTSNHRNYLRNLYFAPDLEKKSLLVYLCESRWVEI